MQKFFNTILLYGLLRHKTLQLKVNFLKLEDMSKKPFIILGIIYYAIPLLLLAVFYIIVLIVLFKILCVFVG